MEKLPCTEVMEGSQSLIISLPGDVTKYPPRQPYHTKVDEVLVGQVIYFSVSPTDTK